MTDQPKVKDLVWEMYPSNDPCAIAKADTIAHENRSVTCGSCSSPVDDLNKDFCNSCAEYWKDCEEGMFDDYDFQDEYDYQLDGEV